MLYQCQHGKEKYSVVPVSSNWWACTYLKTALLFQEDLSAKVLEFLESPHATTDVLLADKEQVSYHFSFFVQEITISPCLDFMLTVTKTCILTGFQKGQKRRRKVTKGKSAGSEEVSPDAPAKVMLDITLVASFYCNRIFSLLIMKISFLSWTFLVSLERYPVRSCGNKFIIFLIFKKEHFLSLFHITVQSWSAAPSCFCSWNISRLNFNI